MLKRILIGFVLILPAGAYGAMTGGMVWDVEPVSGNDTNGCGYNTAAGGSDKSNIAAASLTGLTSAGAGTSILYSGAAAVDIGNVVNITGGTNFTPGRYRISAVSVGVNYTVDRAVTTGAGASGTGMLGGPCASIAPVLLSAISPNIIFVKSESVLTITSSITVTQGQTTPAFNAPRTRIVGYTTTRGDQGMPHIQMSAGSMTQPAVGLNVTGAGVSIENLWMDCNGVATSTGIQLSNNYDRLYNVKVTSCTGANVSNTAANNSLLIANSEFSYATSTSSGALNFPFLILGSTFIDLYVHDNATSGINFQVGDYREPQIIDSIFANNTGAASDGIKANAQTLVMGCVFYKNGRHGFNNATGNLARFFLRNNIFDQNGGYGIVGAVSAGMAAAPEFDGNSYYNNALGTRQNADDAGTVNKQSAVGPYTNVNDVTLTQDPFNNPSANDFTLNVSTGGGLLARGEGFPGAIPGLTTTGYRDMGTFQHRDPRSRGAYVQ